MRTFFSEAAIAYTVHPYSIPTGMKLPSFAAPTLADLRDWWHRHPHPDVRRLILEVQRQRLELLETRTLFDEGFRQVERDAPALATNGMPLSRVRVRLAIEIRRAGVIDDSPKPKPPQVVDFQRMAAHGKPATD
jgi:hypothetical protein